MRRYISLAELMGLILVVGLGLAALRSASEPWLKGISTLTLVLLLISVLGAILHTRPHGAWVGFALFGWGYYLVVFVPALNLSDRIAFGNLFHEYDIRFFWRPLLPLRSPSDAQPQRVQQIVERYIPPLRMDRNYIKPHIQILQNNLKSELILLREGSTVQSKQAEYDFARYVDQATLYVQQVAYSREIAEHLMCLLVGFIGSLLGRFLAGRREPAAA